MSADRLDRYPVGFDEKPRWQQVDFVAFSHTRRGLINMVLSQSDVDVSDRQIERDYYLTKEDLAAIHLTLEGFA